MGRGWILYQSFLCLIFLLSHVYTGESQESSGANTISSSSYARFSLKPYEWRYIRVDLPQWFSSWSLALESDVDMDIVKVNNASGVSLPMICVREGSPPVPDVYNSSPAGLVMEYLSNGSFIGMQSLQNTEKCYPMQKHISLTLTNAQISPGTWYFGVFNGIGPRRTQGKMINRGSTYSFSGNVSVEGCTTSTALGPFCNQSVNALSCNQINNLTGPGFEIDSHTRMGGNAVSCRNANGVVCHDDPKVYLLEVMGVVEDLFIAAGNLSDTQGLNITRSSGLMCYARYESIPLNTSYDFSGDLSKGPLVIKFPKAGRWYIIVQPVDILNKSETRQSSNFKLCYLLQWQVNHCPPNNAGSNCAFGRYMLQRDVRRNPVYVPITETVLSASPKYPQEFALEPLLSNYSIGEKKDDSWIFFILDIPYDATGGHMHIRLSSDTTINYEVYVRYGGLPSVISWDYFYANSSNNSNGSMFFKLYDSTEKTITFYIVYPRAGSWSLGLRRLNNSISNSQTFMGLALESCLQECNYPHGTCRSVTDTSALIYSSCQCNRDRGGFDCDIEVVSHQAKMMKIRVGHIQQSIFLIASNVAALLPAYWALRNKAFPEWVLFTSSGISSALYHACDVGTWCVLSFHVLQFLDFWLSFMAVVSTFVYLCTISEVAKRTIHTVVAILTALLAETGPTSGKNIGYVLGLGALALLVGWFFEFIAHVQVFSFPRELHLNLLEGWEAIKGWISNIFKTIIKRFRWGFIIIGFAALGMAALSWEMENTQSYWVWHSLWHIFIYSSSFFFLCSKANHASCEEERASDARYELTRQNSYGRTGV